MSLFQVFEDSHGLAQRVTVCNQRWDFPEGIEQGIVVHELLVLEEVDGVVGVGQALERQGQSHTPTSTAAPVRVQLHRK